jgi:hypothetical protein
MARDITLMRPDLSSRFGAPDVITGREGFSDQTINLFIVDAISIVANSPTINKQTNYMLPSCRGWACYFPYELRHSNLRAKGPVQTVVCSISLVDDIGGVKSKQHWSLVPKLLVANSAGSGGGFPRHQRVTNKLKSLNCVLQLQA